jgi:putative membrane protein
MVFLNLTPMLATQDDWDHGWWVFWPLLWLAVLGAVIWFVARRRRPPSGTDRAKDILAERFARGELTVDEYRQRLTELS